MTHHSKESRQRGVGLGMQVVCKSKSGLDSRNKFLLPNLGDSQSSISPAGPDSLMVCRAMEVGLSWKGRPSNTGPEEDPAPDLRFHGFHTACQQLDCDVVPAMPLSQKLI